MPWVVDIGSILNVLAQTDNFSVCISIPLWRDP